MIGRRDHQASRRLPGHVSVTVYLVSFIERNRLFQSFFGERERERFVYRGSLYPEEGWTDH